MLLATFWTWPDQGATLGELLVAASISPKIWPPQNMLDKKTALRLDHGIPLQAQDRRRIRLVLRCARGLRYNEGPWRLV